ncbi:ATG12/APG12, putative [Trypanosoma equiperdum]|uniref:Autophagy-related protein n=4 Tax=Trypanozoon TaxID=39700 RepID=Q57WE7_TRYB2|nr:microtubule-associated protein 1A/1B, light chain 3, putative [Trypanosoma brucei gambiense DAL972]XP_845955.1 microtubule-associated protein 1A/1B, light chain 3, putative [Trypanosoma brucei brucei TREU927]AAX70074.1 microtubule-associated protein 1A/1B, light chain 3, putative [Trypanosoma brucei]RHW71328.1 Autophagy-related protein 12 [Trypanosoma brucei equiperdum]SCU66812.1 ATG12/APG12, putative [Trypanosoma equiperdum]AAZ12396.1 microtubule-associated protein 1A/1B, light chain 3, pu|eukprot:XP_011774707.1 microtubule-associated protein 1A/1B, light chain 3, putative [Trypanosoma brucei gambiense DAL972]
MPSHYRYQYTRSFAERAKETESARLRYPKHIPILCEPTSAASASTPRDVRLFSTRQQVQRELDCNKFLLPETATVMEFMMALRQRLLLEEGQAVFVFIGNELPPNSACLGDIYARAKDPDGFLYVSYGVENTFG